MNEREIHVSAAEAGRDILSVVSGRVINESKTRLRRLIAGGRIRANGRGVSTGAKVREGDVISLLADLDLGRPRSASLRIDVLREDEAHLVVCKPAGHSVLPARDRTDRAFFDSLAALLNRDTPEGGPYVRPHIVHRLDRQTSGVLLVAKNAEAGRRLSLQFQHRRVAKGYLGVIEGVLPRPEVTIEIPLARSPVSALQMRPDPRAGKPASTRVVLKRAFGHFSLLEVHLLTGRQHQVRVHLAAIGYPLAVDGLYGRRQALGGREFNQIVGGRKFPAERTLLERCPLHAESIAYDHPVSGERITAVAPLPEDMKRFLALLLALDPACC